MRKYLISHRVGRFMRYTECAVRIKYCRDNEQGWGSLALSLKAAFRVNRKAAGKQTVEGLSLQTAQSNQLRAVKPIT